MNTQQKDYRSSMQQAALAYLKRHQSEHLTDDQALFSRAVNYLCQSLQVEQWLAENLVSAAYGELRSVDCRLHLDISTSTSRTAIITDPASGMTFPIPVSLIVERLINQRRPLSLVS